MIPILSNTDNDFRIKWQQLHSWDENFVLDVLYFKIFVWIILRHWKQRHLFLLRLLLDIFLLNFLLWRSFFLKRILGWKFWLFWQIKVHYRIPLLQLLKRLWHLFTKWKSIFNDLLVLQELFAFNLWPCLLILFYQWHHVFQLHQFILCLEWIEIPSKWKNHHRLPWNDILPRSFQAMVPWRRPISSYLMAFDVRQRADFVYWQLSAKTDHARATHKQLLRWRTIHGWLIWWRGNECAQVLKIHPWLRQLLQWANDSGIRSWRCQKLILLLLIEIPRLNLLLLLNSLLKKHGRRT